MVGVPNPSVVVVIPIKSLDRAKSRVLLPAAERSALALRLGRHTVQTALDTPGISAVAVVTRDTTVAAMAADAGAIVVAEGRRSNLNRAAQQGRATAQRRLPSSAIAIMVSDLPDLTSADLAAAIAEFHSADGPMAVADWEGHGTTLLLHAAGSTPPIRFGPASAQRHGDVGYRLATAPLSGLRRDLDTLAPSDPKGQRP